MPEVVPFSRRERAVLIALAISGATAVNGVFLYGVFVRPDWLREALVNPLALVFIIEALLLMLLLAWLFTRWQVSRIRWGWFIILALLGSLAFAIPVALLWRGHRRKAPELPSRPGSDR